MWDVLHSLSLRYKYTESSISLPVLLLLLLGDDGGHEVAPLCSSDDAHLHTCRIKACTSCLCF